jgi:hypothetical protein
MQAKREPGELLFEEYLVSRGLDRPAHEPDLGVGKRPDYVIERAGQRCVCEVKAFSSDASSFPTTPGYVSFGDDLLLKPIRSQIRQAATQLKPLADSGMPLVVVIANPYGARVLTEPRHVICAMYGDLAVGLPVNPAVGAADADAAVYVADRNGKLTNDHPYISAVVVVREPNGRNAHRVDVFLAASATAVVLPETFFDGPDDRVFAFDAGSSAFRQIR